MRHSRENGNPGASIEAAALGPRFRGGDGNFCWSRLLLQPGIQLVLQESVGSFFSAAYFMAAASIIGRTSFWSESIQSETKFQPLPSHWKTRAVALPAWLGQATFNGLRRPANPSLASLSAGRSRFSRPQRTCSPVKGFLPNFSCAVRTASVANIALI